MQIELNIDDKLQIAKDLEKINNNISLKEVLASELAPITKKVIIGGFLGHNVTNKGKYTIDKVNVLNELTSTNTLTSNHEYINYCNKEHGFLEYCQERQIEPVTDKGMTIYLEMKAIKQILKF